MSKIEIIGYITIILIIGIILTGVINFIISTLEVIEIVHKTRFYKNYTKEMKKRRER